VPRRASILVLRCHPSPRGTSRGHDLVGRPVLRLPVPSGIR